MTDFSKFSRNVSIGLLTVLALVPVSLSWAKQGPAQRVGQGLDNAGKNIRRGVENAVARGQVPAFERDLLARVFHRIHWDKQLVNSTLQLEVQVDGTAILRGAVVDEAAKKRAVDLVQSTVGVTSVVNELVIAKEVKVIQVPAAKPAPVIIVTPPATETVTPPAETKVIIKP